MLIALLIGVLFGLIPARQVLRPDLAKTLREADRSGGQPSRQPSLDEHWWSRRWRFPSCCTPAREAADPEFQPARGNVDRLRTDHSISFALNLPKAKYPTPEQLQFMTALMERMHALHGVQSAGAGFGMPLTPFSFQFSFEIAGRAPLTASR